MTAIHFIELTRKTGSKIFPERFWTGILLFSVLWILPAIILIILSLN